MKVYVHKIHANPQVPDACRAKSKTGFVQKLIFGRILNHLSHRVACGKSQSVSFPKKHTIISKLLLQMTFPPTFLPPAKPTQTCILVSAGASRIGCDLFFKLLHGVHLSHALSSRVGNDFGTIMGPRIMQRL